MTPQEIKDHLDLYVIGHEKAKKSLAVAAYTHSKIIKGFSVKKSNVLLIGPTGCGKTYIVSILAKLLNVAFLSADATKFTAAGYKGRSTEELMSELITLCDDDEDRASRSIIYLDEIDKIKKKQGSDDNDVNGLGVQQSLLKLIEGSEVPYISKHSNNGECDRKLNTKNIMFICSGAFVGLPSVTTSSLISFGMIPEFLGRFSIVAQLHPLGFEDYKKILRESKDSVLHSFKDWFESEGVELIVEESSISTIASQAMSKGLGARGLQNILDEALLNAQFELPSMINRPSAFNLSNKVILSGVPDWRFS